MARVLLVGLLFFVVVGGLAVYQVRTRMSAARLGTDVTYTLDGQGNALVEIVEKTYFVDEETQRNFDGLVAKTGKPDAERFGKGIENSIKSLAEMTGRGGMAASDFEARFDRQAEYGARVYRFRWMGFAEERNGTWVVDFRAADAVKLTRDSSLSIVLPPGAVVAKAEPGPTARDGRRLVWTGAGEVPWPYVEYR